ncbi:hypothetical protein ACFW9N_26125 [Streptomyces sp. NPDC059496]|uniref:hypothetical protein n=1 Tax=Streptomyces sp. NPDC059496 TaxID=3346851 RepID=UPI0036C5FFDA
MDVGSNPALAALTCFTGFGRGYAWCLADFDDEIRCRTTLARVWPLLPPHVRSARQPSLDELDERFRTATIERPAAVARSRAG